MRSEAIADFPAIAAALFRAVVGVDRQLNLEGINMSEGKPKLIGPDLAQRVDPSTISIESCC
jgi:hypothetical protein